jgi:hypothetical protein
MAWFKRNRPLGLVLLAVWLVVHGVLGLVTVNLPYLPQVLAILAIAAGVLILIER